MRKLRDVLRLQSAGLPQRAIAQACGIGLGTVTAYLQRAAAAGLVWPLADDVDDSALEARLFRGPAPATSSRSSGPGVRRSSIAARHSSASSGSSPMPWLRAASRRRSGRRCAHGRWSSPASSELAVSTRAAAGLAPADVAQVLQTLLPEWQAALRRHPAQARSMIAKLLRALLSFTAEAQHEQPGYRVRGQATAAPLLNLVVQSGGAQAVVSSPAASLQNVPGFAGDAQGVASPRECFNERQLQPVTIVVGIAA